MQDKSLESISAMMDGEVEQFELRRVIERTSQDTDLKDRWSRYHLVQDIMKGRTVEVSADLDFASRVSAAIEQEPSITTEAIAQSELGEKKLKLSDAKTQWWKPAASMAVAASVTAVVLLSAGQFDVDPLQAQVNLANTSNLNGAFAPSKYGSALSTVSASSRVSATAGASKMGLYLQQHRDMNSVQPSGWEVNWLPKDYALIESRVNAGAQVFLFSNGSDKVSINVERFSAKQRAQTVMSADKLLGYAVKLEDKFVTVVGPLTVPVAAKIAASVSVK